MSKLGASLLVSTLKLQLSSKAFDLPWQGILLHIFNLLALDFVLGLVWLVYPILLPTPNYVLLGKLIFLVCKCCFHRDEDLMKSATLDDFIERTVNRSSNACRPTYSAASSAARFLRLNLMIIRLKKHHTVANRINFLCDMPCTNAVQVQDKFNFTSAKHWISISKEKLIIAFQRVV